MGYEEIISVNQGNKPSMPKYVPIQEDGFTN